MGGKSKETKRDYIICAARVETSQLTFAGLTVCDGLAEVPVEALLAVVAVPPSSVVPAVQADAAALAPRQLVELHVEAAPPGVEVAVAGCERQRAGTVSICARPQRCQPQGSPCAWGWAPSRPCPGSPAAAGVSRMGCSGGTSGYGKPTANPHPSLSSAMW